jgi:hypothetical protein
VGIIGIGVASARCGSAYLTRRRPRLARLSDAIAAIASRCSRTAGRRTGSALYCRDDGVEHLQLGVERSADHFLLGFRVGGKPAAGDEAKSQQGAMRFYGLRFRLCKAAGRQAHAIEVARRAALSVAVAVYSGNAAKRTPF